MPTIGKSADPESWLVSANSIGGYGGGKKEGGPILMAKECSIFLFQIIKMF